MTIFFSLEVTSRVEAPIFISIKVHISTDTTARQKGMRQDPSFAIKWWAVIMVYKEQ